MARRRHAGTSPFSPPRPHPSLARNPSHDSGLTTVARSNCESFAMAFAAIATLLGAASEGRWTTTRIFRTAIDRLHDEGRYRVFIDILRTKGNYPNARCFAGHNGPKPITVWCSNDYLGMGQHPDGGRGDGRGAARRRRRLGRHPQHLRQHPLSCRARGRARRPSRQGRRAAVHLGLSSPTRRRCRPSASCCPAASSSPTSSTTPR